jgi:hypothetical protein
MSGTPVHKQKIATVTKTFRGKYTRWRKGMKVKALFVSGVGWCIGRIRKMRCKQPLFNNCVAVPRKYLQF